MSSSPQRTLLAAVLALTLVACGSNGEDPASGTTTAATGDPSFIQLCDVLAAARAGDVADVRSRFDHGPLHTLADAAITVDRAIAARLLRAKEAVEADLAEPSTSPDQIEDDLNGLTEAAADAYEATGTSTRPSCGETP